MNTQQLQTHTKRASILLKAMANEKRLLILCHLAEGEKSVSVLEALVGLSQSALSQHLARLRRDRLVKTRRSAQNIFYSIAAHEVDHVLAMLQRMFTESADAPAHEVGSMRLQTA